MIHTNNPFADSLEDEIRTFDDFHLLKYPPSKWDELTDPLEYGIPCLYLAQLQNYIWIMEHALDGRLPKSDYQKAITKFLGYYYLLKYACYAGK